MSTIEFKDLNKSIGTELFTDTESFLEDLGDDAANIIGGNGNIATTYKEPFQTTVYIPTEHDLKPAPVYTGHKPLNPYQIRPNPPCIEVDKRFFTLRKH